MDYEENSRIDIEAGQRVQEKIQFYFLTLTFTLLALAIETHKPGAYRASSIIELFSWLLLIVSGVLGLYRMRLIPKYYKLSVHQNMLRWNIKDALELKRKGERQLFLHEKKKLFDIDMYIEEHEKGIEHFQKEENTLATHLTPSIWIRQSALVVGVIFLAFARAYETIVYVICT